MEDKPVFNEEKINNRIDELIAILKHLSIARKNKYETYMDLKRAQKKKEYEIISFKHKNELYHVPKNAEILSVKRLYDGEVFTVGDGVIWGKPCNILRLFISSNGLMWCDLKYRDGNECHNANIGSLDKAKEVLFTTEDGKEVYNEDNVFLLCTKTWHKSPAISAPKDPFSDDGRIKYFSTEKEREEYILMNKPILSLNDLIIVWDGDRLVGLSEHYKSSPMFQRFKELAKSKL